MARLTFAGLNVETSSGKSGKAWACRIASVSPLGRWIDRPRLCAVLWHRSEGL